jgi:4-oxalocrotonate tautomerase
MDGEISRRRLLKTGVSTLGSLVVFKVGRLAGAEKAIATAASPESAKEITMPHVIVKLWPGKSERQKTKLAEAIVRDVVDILGLGEDSVSVAMEEIDSGDWREKVYKPDILDKQKTLYKKPGYSM